MSISHAAICVGVTCAAALACEYTSVRDAAFTERRDVHWLCMVARAGDATADDIYQDLLAWFDQHGEGLNVEPMRVTAGDPDVAWERDFGFPSAPTAETPLPAVALVGRISVERRGFFMEAWVPGPAPEELAGVRSSPAREAIRDAAMRHIAVLVYFRGTGADAGEARPVIDTVVQRWRGREKVGISVVEVDRTDPRERVLLAFAGVERTGPDRVIVAFGRGKFVRTPQGEPLEGPRLTAARLNDMLEIVMQECTCTMPPRRLGVDLPMVWTPAHEQQVVWLFAGQQGGSAVPAIPADIGGAPVSQRVVGMTIRTLAVLGLGVAAVAMALIWGRHRHERED